MARRRKKTTATAVIPAPIPKVNRRVGPEHPREELRGFGADVYAGTPAEQLQQLEQLFDSEVECMIR